MTLSNLEREILAWFSVNAGSKELSVQCSTASVVSRTHTGPGQITCLLAAPDAPMANFPTNCVPNAPLIESPLLPWGACADLWLKDGKIVELEIVTLGGQELPTLEFPFKLVDAL